MNFLLKQDNYFTNYFTAFGGSDFVCIGMDKVGSLAEGDMLVSLSDYNHTCLDKELTRQAKEKGFTFLRACIVCNEIYIGPAYRSRTACIMCVMDRCRHNDKNADFCKFENIPLPVSEEKIEGSMRKAAALLKNAMEQKETWQNKFTVLCGETEKDCFLIPSYQCEVCTEQKEIEALPLEFQSRKKISKEVHRIRDNFQEGQFSIYADKNFGIFRHMYRDMKSRYAPIYGVEMRLDGDFNESGFGRTYYMENAKISAYLEAVERYSNSAFRSPKKLIRAAYKDIKEVAADPQSFILHNPAWQRMETEFIPYTPEVETDWIWGYSFQEKRPVLVPAQMVFYRDLDEFTTGSRYVYESSNGCALGSCLEEAVFHGLLEVIERDNFLVSWYNRLELVEIEENSLPRMVRNVVERLKKEHYRLQFFDTTMELKIPTVWAVLVDENENPVIKTFSAAGCSIVPEKAIEAAMFEVITSVPLYQEIFNNRESKDKINLLNRNQAEVTELDDHIMLYAHGDSLKRLDFILKPEHKKLPLEEIYTSGEELKQYQNEDLKDDLSNLISNILKYHKDIIVVDISNELTDTFSLKCVKVFVQGMLTMSFGENHKRIDIDRVVNGPVVAGRTKQPADIQNMNQEPHPFP